MALLALGAHGQNLKFRAARWLAITAEHCLAHRGDERIVIEPAAVLVREHHLDLAQPREDFRRELELQRSGLEVRVLRIVGMVAARMTGHELFDLAQVLRKRAITPRSLGTRCRHARELANRRERQVARIERGFE
jgi:hypothetical protein